MVFPCCRNGPVGGCSFCGYLAGISEQIPGVNADENISPTQRDYIHTGLTRIADRLMDLQAGFQKQEKVT